MTKVSRQCGRSKPPIPAGSYGRASSARTSKRATSSKCGAICSGMAPTAVCSGLSHPYMVIRLEATGSRKSGTRRDCFGENFMRRRLRHVSYGIVITVLTCSIPLIAQFGTQRGEWRSYGGDESSTRYSPLDQINRANVKDLKIAWTWKSDNFGSPEFKNESTPLMVNGVLYFTAGGPARG